MCFSVNNAKFLTILKSISELLFFKNTYFEEHLRTAVSGVQKHSFLDNVYVAVWF